MWNYSNNNPLTDYTIGIDTIEKNGTKDGTKSRGQFIK
jgi:hypothetical protein